MRIGVIGAGSTGGNLTRGLRALGHEVRMPSSRGPQILADLAEETGDHEDRPRWLPERGAEWRA